jgi:hypothetical protein
MPFLVHSYISQIQASDYEEYVRIALRTFQSYKRSRRNSGVTNFNMWSEFHQQNTGCDFTATLETLNSNGFSHLIDALPCGTSVIQSLLKDVGLMREKLACSGGSENPSPPESEMPLKQREGHTSEVSDIFLKLIREVFENAAVSLDSSLHDLCMSSQKVCQASDRLRIELGELVPVTAFYDFKTLREVHNYIQPDDVLEFSMQEMSVVAAEKRASRIMRCKPSTFRELAGTRRGPHVANALSWPRVRSPFT